MFRAALGTCLNNCAANSIRCFALMKAWNFFVLLPVGVRKRNSVDLCFSWPTRSGTWHIFEQSLFSYKRIDLTSHFLNVFSATRCLDQSPCQLCGIFSCTNLSSMDVYGFKIFETCLSPMYFIGDNIPFPLFLDTSKLSHIWCLEWLLLMEGLPEMLTCLRPCWCLRTPSDCQTC